MAEKLVIGCGYLGRCVAARWQQQGHRVWATTRSSQRAEEWRTLGWQPVLCDVLDPASLRQLPRIATAVYCVAMDRTAGQSMRTVYVDGLRNVLDAWLERPEADRPSRLIYVSSTSVYGQTGGEEVDETSLAEPIEESGRVVLEAEQLLRQRWPLAVCLRFAGIYGPGRLIGAQMLRAGEAIKGDPEGWLNLIHRDDGVEAVLAAEEKGQAGDVYLISDDRPARRREFYARLAELLGTTPPRFETSADQPAMPQMRANRRLCNRKAREGLNWKPRYPSFEEGLLAFVAGSLSR